MADSNFDIEIKLGLNKTGADDASKKLKEIKEQTTATGKEGVKQEEAVEEATAKTISKKQQLRDMVRGISHEFPILGRFASMALNPIAIATAAISTAFIAARKNLDNIKQSFSGFDATGGKLTDYGEVNKLAEAYERMSLAVGGLGTKLSTFKTNLADAQELIATNAKFFRSMGLDLGTQPEELSQALASDAAAKLFSSGMGKVGAGSRISSEDLDKLKAASDEAETKMAGQKERRQFLSDYRDGKVSAAQFAWRYGSDSSLAEATLAEDTTEGQLEGAMGRYRTARARSALRTEGLGEIAQSDAMARSNLSARRATYAGSGEAIGAATKQLETADFYALPAALAKLINAWDDSTRLVQRAVEDAKMIKSRQDNANQRP